ncbi:uncharacterized protein LOC128387794 [Panonychus citri]|uniref:uncharacterized protein LOC128387794 n=1 Tax=Panonychus citri TaxID=50023 RepID=UPI002307A131|nr:uncharacterized protein LOC128387794 [Panonychus citri]
MAPGGIQIVDKNFPLNVDDVFNLVFVDSPFFQSLLARRHTYNVSIGEWTEIDPCKQSDELKEFKQYRNLAYSMDVNQSMAKTVTTTEIQYLFSTSIPGQEYVIKSEASNMGFPLSSSFRVDTVYYLSRGETENECNLQVYGKVVFKKSAWGMKTLIEESSMQGLNDYIGDLTRSLTELTKSDFKTLEIVNGSFLTNETSPQLTESIVVTCDPLSLSNSVSLRKRQSSSTSSSSLSPNIIEQQTSPLEPVLKARRDHSITPKIQSSHKSEPINKQTDSFLIRTVFILLVLLSVLNCFLYIRLLRLEESAQLLKSIIHPFINLTVR